MMNSAGTPACDAGKCQCREFSDAAVLSKTPLLSVIMITYNHEAYIAQAIEGVLMQETDFLIELIIGEDCSADRTREIVMEYQKRRPDLVRVFTSDVNVGMQRNGQRCFDAGRGKYIAICEGDDYWTDPRKLQKQVDFLEANAEYAMCSHAVKTVFEGGVDPHNPFVQPLRSASFEDIVNRGLFIPSLSMVYRSSAMDSRPEWFLRLFAGHMASIYMITQSGMNYHFDEEMAVKRKNPGGVTQDPVRRAHLKKYKVRNRIFFLKKLNQWSNYQNRKIICREIAKCYRAQMAIDYRKGNVLGVFYSTIPLVFYFTLWNVLPRGPSSPSSTPEELNDRRPQP